MTACGSSGWYFGRPLFNISALWIPRLGELDDFSIEWLGVACRRDVVLERIDGGPRGGKSRTRTEEVLHLLRLPRRRQLPERLPRLQRAEAATPACRLHRRGPARIPRRRTAASDHACASIVAERSRHR